MGRVPGPTRADPFLSPAAASAWAAMGAAARGPFPAGTPVAATYPSYRGGYGGPAGPPGTQPALMKSMGDGIGLSPRGVGPAGGQAALLQSSLLGLSAALAGGAAGGLDPQVRRATAWP